MIMLWIGYASITAFLVVVFMLIEVGWRDRAIAIAVSVIWPLVFVLGAVFVVIDERRTRALRRRIREDDAP